ncbi:hypothetical protein COY07_02575 [Candidatus Peregrinibacteria bacterium CG_4_10_14_0_2_um_filter_43_11]|nr:MAG: hypothetical protein COY07_02575 [Candidatus Peregrinibacteria bacterium CG_4_10_14_0_2_um_filter_43_11]
MSSRPSSFLAQRFEKYTESVPVDQNPVAFKVVKLLGRGNEHFAHLVEQVQEGVFDFRGRVEQVVAKKAHWLGKMWQDMRVKAVQLDLGVLRGFKLPHLFTTLHDHACLQKGKKEDHPPCLMLQPMVEDYGECTINPADLMDSEGALKIADIINKSRAIYEQLGLGADLLSAKAVLDLLRVINYLLFSKLPLGKYKPKKPIPKMHNLVKLDAPLKHGGETAAKGDVLVGDVRLFRLIPSIPGLDGNLLTKSYRFLVALLVEGPLYHMQTGALVTFFKELASPDLLDERVKHSRRLTYHLGVFAGKLGLRVINSK